MEIETTTRPRCDKCTAWQGFHGETSQGECRAHPPTVFSSGVQRFPTVPANQWCREFEQRPEQEPTPVKEKVKPPQRGERAKV